MNFGPQATEEDSFGITDRALERGINFFDTANSYGGGGKEYERKGNAVALAWLLRNPVVTAPITGPRILEHLESALETVSRLEEIFPGPGKPAPEAYAW